MHPLRVERTGQTLFCPSHFWPNGNENFLDVEVDQLQVQMFQRYFHSDSPRMCENYREEPHEVTRTNR